VRSACCSSILAGQEGAGSGGEVDLQPSEDGDNLEASDPTVGLKDARFCLPMADVLVDEEMEDEHEGAYDQTTVIVRIPTTALRRCATGLCAA
jgi:hypothetical protein